MHAPHTWRDTFCLVTSLVALPHAVPSAQRTQRARLCAADTTQQRPAHTCLPYYASITRCAFSLVPHMPHLLFALHLLAGGQPVAACVPQHSQWWTCLCGLAAVPPPCKTSNSFMFAFSSVIYLLSSNVVLDRKDGSVGV